MDRVPRPSQGPPKPSGFETNALLDAVFHLSNRCHEDGTLGNPACPRLYLMTVFEFCGCVNYMLPTELLVLHLHDFKLHETDLVFDRGQIQPYHIFDLVLIDI